jgi:hypothetical protein
MLEARVCLDCGKPLNGRKDKKFCDDACRNNHNNKLNSEDTVYVKKVNSVLKKNRKILQELIPSDGKITVMEKKLKDAEFNFSFYTHEYITKTGTLYRFCYEYGYLKLEENRYMLVKREG